MRTLKILALPALVAGLAVAASANAAAERHYDCTKAGNANKAECKAAAAKPAATPVAAAKPPPAAKPAPTAKPAAPAPAATAAATTTTHRSRAKPTTASGTEKPRSAAQLANDNKMKACGGKWRGLSPVDQAKWDAKGKAKKDKNGNPETGWIAFSSDCRKSA